MHLVACHDAAARLESMMSRMAAHGFGSRADNYVCMIKAFRLSSI
jgi:hypothetical protein